MRMHASATLFLLEHTLHGIMCREQGDYLVTQGLVFQDANLVRTQQAQEEKEYESCGNIGAENGFQASQTTGLVCGWG